MIFELLHAPYPDGYGEGLLSLADCKAHLRVRSADEDELIRVLRDAAIELVEKICSVRLALCIGLIWRAERFPAPALRRLSLGIQNATQITAVGWLDGSGEAVVGDPARFRIGLKGDVMPAIGASWPVGAAGDVRITFNAGYAEGSAPPALLQAVRMLLGHFYINREEMLEVGASGEVPFGVMALCGPFRRILI